MPVKDVVASIDTDTLVFENTETLAEVLGDTDALVLEVTEVLEASTVCSVVGDVVGDNRTFTSEMFAPIALSSCDLYSTIISRRVLPGNTETFPIKSPSGC